MLGINWDYIRTVKVISQHIPTVAPSTSQPQSTTPIPTPKISPSRITSSPSLSPQTHQSPPSPPSMQTTHEPATMPHDLPLPRVHSLRRDEGSMQQTELMDLVTKLIDTVKVLENDLQQTKKVYSSAITKLILRVKKLEKTVKSNKAWRRARIVLSNAKEDVKDPSK
ncbi:hypothetical protein Tco_1520326 [Tanacetum coccineum]